MNHNEILTNNLAASFETSICEENDRLQTHTSTFDVNRGDNTPEHVGLMIQETTAHVASTDPDRSQQYTWERYSSGLARRVMLKMGYKGGGLGKNENGREEAVAISDMDTSKHHKTVIFSSSITKGINPNGFNKLYRGTAKFERFHGRTASDIKAYIPTHLRREQYDKAVIVAGGNDLSNNHVEVDTVAEDVIEAGLVCKKYLVKNVYICSVLPRRYAPFQARRRTLNNILRELCKIFGFIFIENDGITFEHIDRDDVHLTNKGSSYLCKNIVQCLNGND